MSYFSIVPNKPICLKPSPPAFSHQLTYAHLHQNIMKEELQKNKTSAFLREIDALSAKIRDQEMIFQEQKSDLMKQILLLSVEIQHQRQIVGRYDYELRRVQKGMEDIHNVYEVKLQTLKSELIEGFFQQMEAEKQKTFEELSRMRENHQSRLAIIAESHKDKENELDLKGGLSADLKMKIQFMEARISQKQRTIESQRDKIIQLEGANQKIYEEMRDYRERLSSNQTEQQKLVEDLKAKLIESNKLKDEAFTQFTKLKESMNVMEIQMTELARDKAQLKDEVQDSLRKFLKSQKQLGQLQKKYDEAICAQNNRKREEQQQKLEMMQQQQKKGDEWNVFQTKRQRGGSESQENHKALLLQKEVLQGKLKEQQNYVKELTMKNQDLSQQIENAKKQRKQTVIEKEQKRESNENALMEQLLQKRAIIDKLHSEFSHQGESYTKKLEFLTQKCNSLERHWGEKDKELQFLWKNSENPYLKELNEKNVQIQSLKETIQISNQMFQKQLRELKQKLEEGKDSKSKSKGKNQ